MSKNSRKKKSTKEYKSAGFLIPAIAILETIVLIAVSSFAWYYYASEKTLSSAIVTVNADSGLEIDFKDADNTNYIDVWRYLDRQDFAFEPASSVDGREIFFPTSGTFGSDATKSMTFREGTGNDVNSKYVSIDFKLTNTNERGEMDVYLSGKSQFKIKSRTGSEEVGKALRLAMYTNDGSSGKVGSNYSSLHSASQNLPSGPSQGNTASEDTFTVYFEKNSTWGSTIYAFPYDDYHSSETVNYYADLSDQTTPAATATRGSGSKTSWPGEECKWISGNLYSYTFRNPRMTKQYTYTDPATGKTVTATATSPLREYNYIIFSDGSTDRQTDSNGFALNTASTSVNYLYTYNGQNTYDGGNVSEYYSGEVASLTTVYFLKPNDWTVTPKCRPSTVDNTKDHPEGYYYNGDDGEDMTYVTTGIYSYTFPNYKSRPINEQLTYVFFKGQNQNYESSVFQKLKEVSENVYINDLDGKLYYFPDNNNSNYDSTNDFKKVYSTNYSTSYIYFYNDKGFSTPYAYVNAFADDPGTYTYAVKMIDQSDNLYYCEVPDIFLNDVMSARTDQAYANGATIASSGLANNCKVYFADGTGDGYTTYSNMASKGVGYTNMDYSRTQYIYVPTGNSSPYALEDEDYNSYLPSTGGYVVISPGTSAGFQRSASPVHEINTSTGACTKVLPAFASSFSDYIMGSGNPLFTIKAGHTLNLSMIIWLEGTDKHCTASSYAGNNIELYLELATVNTSSSNGNYTYQFIDRTEQGWTNNTVDSNSGYKVAPVMQLYDVTDERGYKMHSSGNVWTCSAPQFLTTEGTTHVIEFRRVNPNDEDEIWNRWSAGNLPTYRSYALSGDTVTYTAFSDSGPRTSTDLEGNGVTSSTEFAAMPDYTASGAGLWGNHQVKKLYVYDGRKPGSISDCNFTSADEKKKATLFMKYTYNYAGSVSQTIEYQCAYSDQNFYCFVVPDSIVEKQCMTAFSCYVLKDGKSANDYDSQGDDVVRRFYNYAGSCLGLFYELNETYVNDDPYVPDNCYWGSDVVYIQQPNYSSSTKLSVSYTTRGVGLSSSGDHCEMRVIYFPSTDLVQDTSISMDTYNKSENRTTYLYEDKSSESDKYNYVSDLNETTIPSYVSVIPCDKTYAGYRVYRLINTDDDNPAIKYDISRLTEYQSLSNSTETPSGSSNTLYYNTLGANSHVLNFNNDYIVMYVQVVSGKTNARIYYTNSNYYDSAKIVTSKTGTNYWTYKIPTNLNGNVKIKFFLTNSQPTSAWFTPEDSRMYVNSGNNATPTINMPPSGSGIYDYNRTVFTDINTASAAAPDSWPQYVVQTGPGS